MPSGAPSIVSTFLKYLMTLFCPSGEWEKALVPFLALRDFGRRRGAAFHTPPHDANDPSPRRTVSHDLFLCSYVINEANLGSTGSTTIQMVFPHVQAGDDSHLAIFTTPHVTQANTHLIMVKSKGSGVRECRGSGQAPHFLGQGTEHLPVFRASICEMGVRTAPTSQSCRAQESNTCRTAWHRV